MSSLRYQNMQNHTHGHFTSCPQLKDLLRYAGMEAQTATTQKALTATVGLKTMGNKNGYAFT